MAKCICGIGRGKAHMKYCPVYKAKQKAKSKLKYHTIEFEPIPGRNGSNMEVVSEVLFAVRNIVGPKVNVVVNYDPICDTESTQAHPYMGNFFVYIANRDMTLDEMNDAFRLYNGVSRETYLDDME